MSKSGNFEFCLSAKNYIAIKNAIIARRMSGEIPIEVLISKYVLLTGKGENQQLKGIYNVSSGYLMIGKIENVEVNVAIYNDGRILYFTNPKTRIQVSGSILIRCKIKVPMDEWKSISTITRDTKLGLGNY